MKLNKTQLEQFESLLKSQGYKRDYSYKAEFAYWKSIIKEEDFSVYVHFDFYDFSKYKEYIPKEFPFSFEPRIIVIDTTLSTELKVPFIWDEKPLFAHYNDKKKCFVEREWNEEKILDYLEDLGDIALKFKEFYLQNIADYINKE